MVGIETKQKPKLDPSLDSKYWNDAYVTSRSCIFTKKYTYDALVNSILKLDFEYDDIAKFYNIIISEKGYDLNEISGKLKNLDNYKNLLNNDEISEDFPEGLNPSKKEWIDKLLKYNLLRLHDLEMRQGKIDIQNEYNAYKNSTKIKFPRIVCGKEERDSLFSKISNLVKNIIYFFVLRDKNDEEGKRRNITNNTRGSIKRNFLRTNEGMVHTAC